MTKLISVEYIGPKDVYEDIDFKTGEWTPGVKKDVPITVAPHMLWHHDMFRDARSAAARKKEPIVPSQKQHMYKEDRVDKEPPLANLAVMEKSALSKYAETQFQHRFDYDKTTAQQMRVRIIDLMRERA